jgi:hypothetical protein
LNISVLVTNGILMTTLLLFMCRAAWQDHRRAGGLIFPPEALLPGQRLTPPFGQLYYVK